jgi:hypothetical protein
MTLKQLLDEPLYRNADGSLTDSAYQAYRDTCDAQPNGFVADDDLDRVEVVWPERKTLKLSGNMIVINLDANGESIVEE